jgi:phosphoribosyl 1,2-cyclic phosphodiesterase
LLTRASIKGFVNRLHCTISINLGLDETVVENVLMTHWHDDHSRGASALVRATPAARVWIAQTLTTAEFLRFAMRMNKNKAAVAGSKLKEFIATIQEIAARRQAGATTFGFALQNLTLHQVHGSQLAHGQGVKLTALSPSHVDHLDFLMRVADMLPRARQPKRSLGGPSPNEVSVASLLEIGPSSILLGADLEFTKSGAGWDAVLTANRSNRFGVAA